MTAAKPLTFPKAPEKARSLTPRQERAIAALIAGRTLGQAAAAAHVDAKTLFRWRADPSFSDALRHGRDAAFREALEELRRVSAESVRACAALLKASHKPEVRIAAARTLLGLSLRANEAVNFEARLASLEGRLSK